MAEYYAYQGLCLCPRGGRLPQEATPVAAPFHPLLYLVERDPLTHGALRPLPSSPQRRSDAKRPGSPAGGITELHSEQQTGSSVFQRGFLFRFLLLPQHLVEHRAQTAFGFGAGPEGTGLV